MPGTPSRRFVHTRSICVRAYARDDGLWDLEAELTDVKEKDFALATGMRRAGDPVHAMQLRLTIDTALNVVAAQAQSDWVPYPGHCDSFSDAYRQLVGLNLLSGFRHAVQQRLGGTQGCTHLTELAGVLPTAAIQAFAGEVYRPRDQAHEPEAADHQEAEKRPFQLERCRALRVDGPAVARYYPRWYTGNRKQEITEEQGK
jgi:3,4-dihydroxy-2-butanone 4-phosphate synthase